MEYIDIYFSAEIYLLKIHYVKITLKTNYPPSNDESPCTEGNYSYSLFVHLSVRHPGTYFFFLLILI